jgi:4-hydroxy-tetrahydrodipicolinate synthase
VTNLSPDTVIRLSQIDNIIGIKEASGNLNQVAQIIAGTDEDFLLYSGNDGDTFPIMALGGYGVISAASHLVGRRIKGMMQSILKGDIAEAATMHRRLMPLFNALFLVSNPIPVKYALNYLGFAVGKPRLPLTPPDEATASAIEAALENYKDIIAVPQRA